MKRQRDSDGKFIKEEFNQTRVDNDVVYIQLNSSYETVVDLCDFNKIKSYRWNIVQKQNNKKYAFTRIRINGKQKTILLHRLIFKGIKEGKMIDHIDGDGLNNRRKNLRLASNSENQQNNLASKNSQIGIRGISICKTTGLYKCQLTKMGKLIYHERFKNLEDAQLGISAARQKYCTHLPQNHPYVLNIHAVLPQSEVNGPGERLVIWTQGCTKGCKGCFNESTWSFKKNKFVFSRKLAAHVISSNPEGITLTGGDPLEQPEALLEFLRALHGDGSGESLRADFLPKGIICFTGFLIEELDGAAAECLEYIDLLIDGRYVEQLRYTSGLAGSSNQRFHFSSLPGRGESRLQRSEILIDQAVEVHIDDIDPSIIRVTGFPSIDRTFLKRHGLRVESDD